jgi:hypothetical protein
MEVLQETDSVVEAKRLPVSEASIAHPFPSEGFSDELKLPPGRRMSIAEMLSIGRELTQQPNLATAPRRRGNSCRNQ